jgi:hypothetical protein
MCCVLLILTGKHIWLQCDSSVEQSGLQYQELPAITQSINLISVQCLGLLTVLGPLPPLQRKWLAPAHTIKVSRDLSSTAATTTHRTISNKDFFWIRLTILRMRFYTLCFVGVGTMMGSASRVSTMRFFHRRAIGISKAWHVEDSND